MYVFQGGWTLEFIYRSREIYRIHKGEICNAYPVIKKNYQAFIETEIVCLFALCCCDKHDNQKQLKEERDACGGQRFCGCVDLHILEPQQAFRGPSFANEKIKDGTWKANQVFLVPKYIFH
jgi:hypothetical protein